ncbi:MAG: serine/threonine protein kinase [Deltaproteobacteria bacterium]|nr:serine/threonine protein kinase [Deltaproteobacteria bacterium]
MGTGAQNVRVVGRYALYGAIAAGGMATVHLGRLLGPVGFSRTVAIKRLHAQFASDPEFVSMFLDEARLAARIRHPNVVPTLDVVATGGELFLVMDYVPGESVARISRVLREQQQTIPQRIISAIMAGVLHGLHAAHEAKDERGDPLGIVHRDMSPQNVLVGADGVPRVLDFGVAKAAGRMQTTRDGQIKGKLAYMPPEQLRGAAVSRQTDIYAAGVMLWELVTGQRLFTGDNEGAVVAKILEGRIEAPSKVAFRGMSRSKTLTDAHLRSLEALDSTILRSLQMDAESRFGSAREMALEIEKRCAPATASEVADWLETVAKDVLTSRAAMVAEIESSASMSVAEGQGHVQSVLSAKATLQPGKVASPVVTDATRLERPSTQNPVSPMNPVLATTLQMANAPISRSSTPAPLDGPPVTQPSSISVATGPRGRGDSDAGGKRTLVAAIVGVMLGASVLASALVYRYTQRAPQGERTSTDPSATAVAAGHGSATTPPPPLTSTATTLTTPLPTEADAGATETVAAATASASSTAAPTAPASTKGGAKGGTGTKNVKGTATATTTAAPPEPKPADPKPDCQIPFWYDATGVKHYRPECLVPH